jgi:hypothetical protein
MIHAIKITNELGKLKTIMKKLYSVVFAALAMLAVHGAQAGGITDIGNTAYWGGNDHGIGDVIGASTYDIQGATITRVGTVLTITIATNFAGHAGADSWSTPKGIGYGDVFLANAWNPAGTDAHHLSDNAANGTKWSYGFSLDNRWSNNSADNTFKLYKLNGTSNAANILNSGSFMQCGTQCTYRDGQATAVKTVNNAANVEWTGLTGKYSITANKELKFTINVASTDLVNFASFAMHWGETCQNDVIEGVTSVVPAPGSLPLLGLGLGAMLVLRRRQRGQLVAKS